MVKRIAGFCGLLLAGILLLGKLFTPAWNWPTAYENPTASVQEEEKLEAGTAKVYFAGSSHMGYALNPMRLYENTGLVSYNLGTNAQSIDISWYMAQRAVKAGAEVFVLDVSSLFFEWRVSEGTYRFVLDSAGLSPEKLALARCMVDSQLSRDASAEAADEWVKALVPLVRYHDRWESLTETDFTSRSWNYCLQGYYLSPNIWAAGSTVDEMNSMTEMFLQENEKNGLVREKDGKWQQISGEEPLYSYEISEENQEYLDKIVKLCEENNCELLLVKIPNVRLPQDYSSAWTREKSNFMHDYAEEKGLQFLDLEYDAELGIDWKTDSQDGGYHLNYRGSRKVTDFIGEYLLEHYSLETGRCDRYEAKRADYDRLAQAAELITATDLQSYGEILAKYGRDVDVFIAVSDDMRVSLTEEDMAVLHSLGLEMDFDAMEYQDAYIAVIDSGNVVYEGKSNRQLSCEGETDGGLAYRITSSGWYSGAKAVICLDDEDCARNARGINIAVYDHASGKVIDSVNFDTWSPEHACGHNSELFFAYEEYIFSGGGGR